MSCGLLVEGTPQSHGTNTAAVPLAIPGPSGSTGAGHGATYRQLVPISKKPGSTLNVKVVQATMRRQANGKLEFTSTGQAFIDVTDSTANVHYITNVVQKKWGAEFQLVTADGLQLEDSSGTQGVYHAVLFFPIIACGLHSACITFHLQVSSSGKWVAEKYLQSGEETSR